MQSPLDDLYGTPQKSVATMQSPLDDLYGASQTTAVESQPVESTSSSSLSRREIAASDDANAQKNIEQLKALLTKSNLQPQQRQRIEKMIQRYTAPMIGGIEVGNRITDPSRGALENVGRGVLAGGINYGILGASDVVAGIAELPFRVAEAVGLPKSFKEFLGIPKFRDQLHEAQQIIKEFFDPQGFAGAVGTVVGTFGVPTGVEGALAKIGLGETRLVAAVNPFKVLNSIGLKAIQKVPGIGPQAAAVIVKGIQPGATALQRIAANLVGASTVDAAFAADILTDPQMNDQEKAVSLATVVLASGGSAVLGGLRRNALKIPVESPKSLPEGPVSATRTAEADALIAKGLEAQKAANKSADLNSRLNRAGKANWEVDNPDRAWKDLSKQEKAEILKTYRDSHTNLDNVEQSTESLGATPPQPPLSSGESALKTAGVPTGAGAGTVPPVVDPAVVGSTRETLREAFKETDPVRRVNQLRQYLKQSVSRAKARAGRRGLWANKTDEQLRASADRDALNKVSWNQELKELLPTLTEDQRTAMADYNEIAQRVGANLERKIETVGKMVKGNKDVAINVDDPAVIGSIEPKRPPVRTSAESKAIVKGVVDRKNAEKRAKVGQELLALSDEDFKLNWAAAISSKHPSLEVYDQIAKLRGLSEPELLGTTNPITGESTPGIRAGETIPAQPSIGEPAVTHGTVVAEGQIPGATKGSTPSSEVATDQVIRRLQGELSTVRNERDLARREAETDALTGVGNKDAFLKAHPAADVDPFQEITFFDVTNFKQVNDSKGHVEGDKKLIEVANAIKTATMSVDAPVRVFRQGDEFMLIHPKGEGEEIVSIAKQLVGNEDVGGFNIALRGATAETYEKASIAANVVKQGEIGPKKRPGAKPTLKSLDSEIDKLDILFDKGKITKEQFRQRLDEIAATKDVIKSKGIETQAERDAAIEAVYSPIDYSAPTFVTKEVKPAIDKRLQGTDARQLFKSDPKKMSLPDLFKHRDDIQARMSGMDRQSIKDAGYDTRLAFVNEEIVSRGDTGGFIVQTHPAVTGFAAGFGAGLVLPANDDQTRFQHALYLGVLAAAGTSAYLRRLKSATDASVPKYQQEIRKHVKSVEDAPLEHRVGVFSKLMKMYGNVARRDIGITNVSKLSGAQGFNASKQAQLFGLGAKQADNWILGDRVGYWTNDGEFIQLDAKSLTQIAAMVDGDVRTVGDLAASKLELVLRGREKPKTTGLSLEVARQMYVNTPERYHQAAEELSKLYRALKETSVASGLLSRESSNKMDEQSFYVAIRRLFDNELGSSPQTIDVKGKRKSSIGPENLFKNLQGSKRPMQNPFEAAIELITRYHKANELNRLAVTFFDEALSLPVEERSLIIKKRLNVAETPKVAGEDVKIADMRATLEESGSSLSSDETRAIISSLSDESLNVTNDVVRVYREGKMEVYRVSDPIARAFRSLQAHELSMVMEGLGILTKPTNFARVGITANPVFIGWQAFRDIWQYHQNGAYGLPASANIIAKTAQAPVSLAMSATGSLRGWLAHMFNTGEYKTYKLVGGGGESVASQGLQVLRGDIRKSTNVLEQIREGTSANQWTRIGKEIKEMHFHEAYASIMAPIADAGRVGAYLHERGRGANPIEALYKAKRAGANFGNKGDLLAIQGLNRMTLFLNASIQSLDASRFAFMRDKSGYIVRGIAGITIPSMLLWAAYKDDEEISQLRSTPYGNKFWWIRVNGQIVKLPKPIFDGQVFGSSAEAWLDRKYNEDPLAVRKWMEGMYNDVAVNLLPFVGVVPISLMTGKVVGLGSDVVPSGTENLDVEMQARPETSTLARLVSEATGSIARKIDTKFTDRLLSPAGLEFVANQYLGGLRSEMGRALSIAMDISAGNDAPIKEELPFVRSLFGKYPSLNVAAIQEFYTMAERAQRAANTATAMAQTNPDKLADFFETRMSEIQLADMYSKSRSNIVDLRKAIEDIRSIPVDVMSSNDKRDIINTYLRLIIDEARTTNEIARSITQATAIAAKP